MYVRSHKLDVDADPVSNYYEKLVVEMIGANTGDDLDAGAMADIACIALNNLPPKYIRHNVDMAFFNTLEETEKMRERVRQALADAEQYVRTHHRQ
jgi:competence protein ComFB